MVLDGGHCDVGIESTIVDVTGEVPVVLRLGLITAAQLEKELGMTVSYSRQSATPSSGRATSHYKPAANVYVVDRSGISAKLNELTGRGRQVGLVLRARIQDVPTAHHTQIVGDGTHAFARKLYDCLRFADSKGVDDVIVEPPNKDGVGEAILDRLERASVSP
jgi:L-threonylcarbamoyladenylate synthase